MSRNTRALPPLLLSGGIKFFFEHTLHRDFPILNFIRPHREKKLPAILSPDEVRRILQLLRLPAYRTCLSTIYSCGLRLQEGTRLQVADLDSSRMMIHLRDGKGAKDRYVPLPLRTLELLRQYWGTHRNPILIFPSAGRDRDALSKSTLPIPAEHDTEGLQGCPHRKQYPEKSFCSYSATFLGDSFTGGRRQPSSHSRVPHVHYIVTGGGLSADGQWRTSRQDFLVHIKPLSILFRANFRDLLKQTDLFHLLDLQVWRKDWVVHSQPVGSGESAFKYLAPYIFRVAISNRRILALEDGQVTFSYKDSATDQTRFSTIPAEEFIRRFLQNVLPKGFVKVRYYGLLAASNRHLLDQARQSLTTAASHSNSSNSDCQREDTGEPPRCPKCGAALRLVESLQPKTRWPP